MLAATLGETALGLPQDVGVNKALLNLEAVIEARVSELLNPKK